jgi:hypothetical protein
LYCRRAYIHDPIHEEYRKARNSYTSSIKTAKDKCWEKWLAAVDDYKIWQAHTYILTQSMDASRTRVPTLTYKGPDNQDIKATTNLEKTEAFRLEFFPTAPDNT